MDKKEIKRCGYCGRWFIGLEYIDLEDLKEIKDAVLNAAFLGYCPNAQQEHFEQNPDSD